MKHVPTAQDTATLAHQDSDRLDQQYQRLVRAWLAHEELRKSNPSLEALWASRRTLDRERLAAAALAVALDRRTRAESSV